MISRRTLFCKQCCSQKHFGSRVLASVTVKLGSRPDWAGHRACQQRRSSSSRRERRERKERKKGCKQRPSRLCGGFTNRLQKPYTRHCCTRGDACPYLYRSRSAEVNKNSKHQGLERTQTIRAPRSWACAR